MKPQVPTLHVAIEFGGAGHGALEAPHAAGLLAL